MMITPHKQIAAEFDHNVRDVFNHMIDAIVACGPQYALFAQTLEVIGLALQNLRPMGIDHD